MKLSEIAEVAGLSKAYASQVRAGKFTPHVSNWVALAELAGVEVVESAARRDDVRMVGAKR